jgi:hypothetical protein
MRAATFQARKYDHPGRVAKPHQGDHEDAVAHQARSDGDRGQNTASARNQAVYGCHPVEFWQHRRAYQRSGAKSTEQLPVSRRAESHLVPDDQRKQCPNGAAEQD